jgi:hypothetical protein
MYARRARDEHPQHPIRLGARKSICLSLSPLSLSFRARSPSCQPARQLHLGHILFSHESPLTLRPHLSRQAFLRQGLSRAEAFSRQLSIPLCRTRSRGRRQPSPFPKPPPTYFESSDVGRTLPLHFAAPRFKISYAFWQTLTVHGSNYFLSPFRTNSFRSNL